MVIIWDGYSLNPGIGQALIYPVRKPKNPHFGEDIATVTQEDTYFECNRQIHQAA